ncbi:class I SAM-dependent methyltransferase [Hansschlegelia zhihuaiae]|uniref:Class I SAM-dependent methyltransferase n=1 Tax=Hansschlegelia zhihuaiae TaxID=405005 RepID=A0A4Q0M2U1_9HYPH|nr:class I SAM-dependent methyltransferase [Hansschlegelia zhihuaiae]RXF67221.1 class I SAM-dependent methyltransferase [Hansschlegelia zhihuaiae]
MTVQRQHHEQFEKRRAAASVVLGVLRKHMEFPSVLDIGCGVGAWLASAKELGAREVLGVDGPWIETEFLGIEPSEFIEQDLNTPMDLGRKFDLVISIEVGEHLKPEAARDLVATITRHGDAAIFSAAMPGQGGAGHINEQWPEYWVGLFREEGFDAYDAIRRVVWEDRRVFPWIQQNCLVFVRSGAPLAPTLARHRVKGKVATMVHRVTYSRLLKKYHELQASTS